MSTIPFIIGIFSMCYGGTIIYYAQSEKVPAIIKPLIKGEPPFKRRKVQLILSLISGIILIIVGFLGITGELIGKSLVDFLPFL